MNSLRREAAGSRAGATPASGAEVALLALLALTLAAALFFAQGWIGLDLSDEGFLWYGAVHTAHGEVPLRDFSSYDPGRYLWAAGWSRLLGDGVLALRFSTALFAALGLLCGLLAARRAVTGRGALILAGVLLALWMFPRHKLFEPSLAMAAVYLALRVIELRSRRSWFLAGAGTGLAAFFGKNHGLYWALACLTLLLWLSLRIERGGFGRHLLAWSAGIAVGSLPFLAMALAVPGFLRAEVDSVLFFVAQGTTNNPLPVPWPWRVSYAGAGLAEDAARFALGTAFLLLPLLYLGAAALAWRTDAANLGRRRLLLAAAAVGVFYMQHAFSRSDPAHLGQAIHPALLGALALPLAVGPAPRRLAAVLVAGLLAFLTLFAAVPQSDLFRRFAAGRRGVRYVASDVAGDRLSLPAGEAERLTRIRAAVAARVGPAEPLLILPDFPGLYPFLGRGSPVWDIYMTWPAIAGSDQRRIAEIEERKVRWVLLDTYRGDVVGLSLRSTHSALSAWLDQRFAAVPAPDLPPRFALLLRR
jgi:hypothetical protein